MKFVTYVQEDIEKIGVVSRDQSRLYPLDSLGLEYASMLDLIAGYTLQNKERIENFLAAPSYAGILIGDIKLAAPIPHPKHDIICVGQNYTAHAIEACRSRGIEYVKTEYPTYFSKRAARVMGDGESINAHSDITDRLDYEVELAVIIGKICSHVAKEDVFDYVFGYTIANDISARDIQQNHSQFYFGKSLDEAIAMGPCIVTRDEFQDPPHLNITTHINGELRQNSNTRDFIFDIPYLISQLSEGITLLPGDVLITGTPSGVAMGMNPPKYMRSGDVVKCSIEGIGKLTNMLR